MYVDGKRYGSMVCNRNDSVPVPPGRLDILVENQGRVNMAMGENDRWNKGLDGVLIQRPETLFLEMYPLALKDLSRLRFGPYNPSPAGPCFTVRNS